MELSPQQQQLQSEAEQLAESHAALLAEARNLVQSGRADEAINLYRSGHRDIQAFHNKWDSVIRSDEPSLADGWRQFVADQEVTLLTFEGYALQWVGRLDEASALFERALALTPADTLEHASRLNDLGTVRHDQQAYAEAEELLRRAHAEYVVMAATVAQTEPASAPEVWSQAAQVLADSAYAALCRGDYAGFEKSYYEAISFAEQHHLPDLANKLWLRQARHLLELDASGETTQRFFTEGEQRVLRSKDTEFKFEALRSHAEYFRVRGEPDLTRYKLEDALEIAPPHQKWALLRQLADIAETQGDIQAAHDYSRDALAEARQGGMPGPVIACLGALVSLHAADNPDEAERYLSEMRASGEKVEIKNALLSRAFIYYQQKRFELALQDVDEAERAMPEEPGVLLMRVLVLRGMDAKEEALRVIERAVAAFNKQIRRGGADWKSDLGSLAALHEGAARIAAELGRTEESFVWAESGKALRLRSRFVEPTDAANTTGISLSALRERLLAESATLLFFSVTHRGTLALLCDPHSDKPQSFFIDLTEQALADLLPDKDTEAWNTVVFEALRPLSEKLAPCLSEAISRKETGTLYIVPDSRLYFVPFAALDVEGGSKVIDHCAVICLPYAAMLVSRPQAAVRSRTCLAVGAGGKNEFSFSEQAAQIAALRWDTSVCLAEARAQEVLDKAPHFSVLHLQCHGRLEDLLPGTRSASFLKLGDETTLSAKDVYGLSLSSELVFMNACISGRFKSRLSNEVGGFWEAFLHAGAGGVIVTLAYVHPESAQHLALAFYRHWLNGKSSGEALRQAQLEVRQEKPKPCDWAAHILIGVG